MMQGTFRTEAAPRRQIQGNGPVDRFEVQEARDLDLDGNQIWYVWHEGEDAVAAMDACRAVRGFAPGCEVRLAKITTTVMEVE
jgi:hypothetical protein